MLPTDQVRWGLRLDHWYNNVHVISNLVLLLKWLGKKIWLGLFQKNFGALEKNWRKLIKKKTLKQNFLLWREVNKYMVPFCWVFNLHTVNILSFISKLLGFLFTVRMQCLWMATLVWIFYINSTVLSEALPIWGQKGFPAGVKGCFFSSNFETLWLIHNQNPHIHSWPYPPPQPHV